METQTINLSSDHAGCNDFHVLAVDDSNIDRKLIQRLLQISSFKVTVVESGSRALQYLGLDEEKNYDRFNDLKVNLIMTDYSMPGMTGFELLQKIKNSSTLREIPVVIMSSENIVTRIDRCLEEGAEEYLLKPVKLSDVRRLKETILKSAAEESDGIRSGKRKRNVDEQSEVPKSLDCDGDCNEPLSPPPSPVKLSDVRSLEESILKSAAEESDGIRSGKRKRNVDEHSEVPKSVDCGCDCNEPSPPPPPPVKPSDVCPLKESTLKSGAEESDGMRSGKRKRNVDEQSEVPKSVDCDSDCNEPSSPPPSPERSPAKRARL